MRVLVAASGGRAPGGRLLPVSEAGVPAGPVVDTPDLAAAVAELERRAGAGEGPRWVWESTARIYPRLLRAGVRVGRCHDLRLTESLLLGHEERGGGWSAGGDGFVAEPGGGPARQQESLFDELVPAPPSGADLAGADLAGADPAGADPAGGPDDAEPAGELHRLLTTDQHQQARIAAARTMSPGFGLLVAAESAAALAAAEMGWVGLPWRADVHDRILTGLLGERPRHGGRPPVLQELAVEIATALSAPGAGGGMGLLNVDSPAELLKAFRRQGVPLQTTRARELQTVEHPAVAPLLRYKELARLHVAHGWAWRDTWVREGRFKPEFVPGGVVSGRWATRGGGALQIPKAVRAAVVADPGWVLVVADAGQLEPRILAAMSEDPGMIAATRAGDLYTEIATRALGRADARAEAKIGLLAAMYGGGTGSPALAALRRRFPRALALLESAARTGEDGGVVRSALGRTCPHPEPGWQDAPEAVALARSRARGRFTRNFVVQASAADWANTLVAGLRRRLAGLTDADGRADIVFFQHDEVMVHAPKQLADTVVAAITESGEEATRLVVGERGVRVPLNGLAVTSYAEKP